MPSHTHASTPPLHARGNTHTHTHKHTHKHTQANPATLCLQVFSSDKDNKVSKADQAKQLLAKYGSAYLITSISFAIVSFGTCYTLVNAGAFCARLSLLLPISCIFSSFLGSYVSEPGFGYGTVRRKEFTFWLPQGRVCGVLCQRCRQIPIGREH